ncbi:hypothetical protein ACFL6X_07545 [Candidatus Latescibacterota bacterium]
MVFGFGASWHLRATSIPARDGPLHDAFARARARMGTERAVGLGLSPAVRSPLVTDLVVQ